MSQNAVNANSCVETPAAPEWLSKLENRREKLTRGKLGHEAGAGAPCNECGEKCPGLDLHFWRKVCRNCKCRKDQHMCVDDDMSGWAQFEILGQIRSKPAYIKIKALASQPVQVEWVPPNAAPDVVSDYMEKLGTSQIPVAGSDAAHKRKQQLEFQVPPHDLDASLCDNLTETEAQQLQQYVQKLREQCVGQGAVVRIGGVGVAHGVVGYVVPKESVLEQAYTPQYVQVMNHLGETPVADSVLSELLTANKLASAIVSPKVESALPKLFIAFSEPISESGAEFDNEKLLSNGTKDKLLGLNKAAVQSLVSNGPIYDKILAALKHKNLNIARDPKLGPIAEFRKEYTMNPQFKADIDGLCQSMPPPATPQYATPLKTRQLATPFNSPLPVKYPAQARFGAQMRQDTPMRKVKFGGVTTVVYECGLPPNVDYEKDPVFAQIVHAEPLKVALENARAGQTGGTVVIAQTRPPSDVANIPGLSPTTKDQLQAVGVNANMLKSSVSNAPYYDRLYQTLNDKGIDYSDCKLLAPLNQMHDWLLNDEQLLADLDKVFAQMANNQDVKYGAQPLGVGFGGDLTNSHSNDSGFHSKASTPNYGNYSGVDELNAAAGKFASIPGIEDMNMYPSCAADSHPTLPNAFQQLKLSGTDNDSVGANSAHVAAPLIKCRDCTLPISFGDVAVKAERAGKEIAWHPDCFKCHTCRELLADLVYFFHHGQVYCGRDLAIKLKIPRCKACDELIFTKEYTAAESATFHIKHFCCYQCDTPLAGQQYIPDEKSNMPLCLKCYDEFFAVSCQRCCKPIGPADQGVAWGEIHWHGQCFICAGVQCNKSLIGGRFCVKQNKPFCSPACVRSVAN